MLDVLPGSVHIVQCRQQLSAPGLADIVGLTPIHANRILNELRKLRILEIHRGALSVLDLEKLQFVCGNG